LAADIRSENVEHFYNNADQFVFISEQPIEIANNSINFHLQSLARFPNTPSVCTATADFVDCLKESARSGVKQQKLNESSIPLWQVGDVTHARADKLFGDVGDSSSQVSSLSTAIQLFLPGAVKIYYGEELGLPSTNQGIGQQMQWEETEKGFSDLTGKHFFASLPPKQAAELNFKSQSGATHSHLKVFKKLAELRARDEVFLDGEYNTSKVDGLNVFVRTLNGNDKAYLLVANWPTAADKSPRQFTVNQIIKPFNLKVGSAEFLIDHPLNEKNQWHIELDTALTMNPYEFALVRVQILA
jgi:glycosidase